MYTLELPEPWVIAELERMRRDRESQRDERPALELPLPPPRSRGAPASEAPRSVIVIDLG